MRLSGNSLLLYAVTDRRWLGNQTLYDQIEQALAGGITCLQLREKELAHDAFIHEIQEILPLCHRYSVPVIVNDDVDAAVFCKADGVHVGQTDMSVLDVRRCIGNDMILGASVQTVEQALQAQDAGADYLGVGSVFCTQTKPDAEMVSYNTLKKICDMVHIPVVAIGGIDQQTVKKLSGSGIQGVAVVSALFSVPDISHAAAVLRTYAQEICLQ